MILRFAMGIGPMIPVFPHWVLAGFLLVLGSYHKKASAGR